MKTSKLIIGVALAVMVMGSVAVPAAARSGGADAGGRGMGRMGCGMGPQFTLEQQEQMKKIHEKYDDERVELTNRLKVLGVEMQELIAAEGEPDFSAIERKMEDASAARLELAKLRLRIHKEIRPILTDDQKVLFDDRMGLGLMRGRHGGFGPGAMQHCRMRPGMGRGMCGEMRHRRRAARCCIPGAVGSGGAGGPGMPGCMMGGAPLDGQPTIKEIE